MGCYLRREPRKPMTESSNGSSRSNQGPPSSRQIPPLSPNTNLQRAGRNRYHWFLLLPQRVTTQIIPPPRPREELSIAATMTTTTKNSLSSSRDPISTPTPIPIPGVAEQLLNIDEWARLSVCFFPAKHISYYMDQAIPSQIQTQITNSTFIYFVFHPTSTTMNWLF
uniref:Uncharacterized protein n=1 Tax=Triticum urartu TaxID=4572 RepID=A0A8R7TBB7_TRIUA